MTTSRHGFTIRPATAADADAIGLVHVQSWQWAYRGHFPDEYLDSIDVERRTRWWRNSFRDDPEMVVFVAVADDAIVGYCHVGPSRTEGGGVGELYSIYLLESAAGRGIGTALMSEAVGSLRSMGFAEAMLWVLGSNAATRRFYEVGGWYDDGGRSTHMLRGGVEAAAVRYRITLGDAA